MVKKMKPPPLPPEIAPNCVCNAIFDKGFPVNIPPTEAQYLKCPMCGGIRGYKVRDPNYLAWSCFDCIETNVQHIKQFQKMEYIPPAEYATAKVSKINKEYHEPLKEWCKGKSSPTLILAGGFGSGKTYAAHALARFYSQNRGPTIRFLFFGDIILRYREEMQIQGFKTLNYEMREADLLVIDDFGLENTPTDNFLDMLIANLDYRMTHRKDMIITTNKTFTEIRDLFGDRIASRLSRALVVKFKEEDKRQYGN